MCPLLHDSWLVPPRGGSESGRAGYAQKTRLERHFRDQFSLRQTRVGCSFAKFSDAIAMRVHVFVQP